jgi:outer membrane protein assembly factor BamE (lipoprotein component of BamABCDE complex)
MSVKPTAVAFSLAMLAVSACSPTNSFQGFQVVDQAPADVKVGTDTRDTVLARLGSPTATSTFDKNTWFYISQVSNKTAFYHPRILRRDIVAIQFDKNSQTVTALNTYTLKDGRIIAFNGRETPTRGRQITVLEQLIGSISAASALPPDENQTPGSHPDDPGPH